MPRGPSWKVDVKSLSTEEIVRLLRQLDESQYRETSLDLRRELVRRARDAGAADETIIRTLTRGVPRGPQLHKVAKEWADTLGMSIVEFKRIASAK